MSQAGVISVSGGGGGGSPVETLTGNTGGAVPPTANNINVIGASGITVAGNPGTSTLTISLTSSAENYVQVTGPATYNVLTTDYFISCDSSAGAITINLPDAPDNLQQYIVKDRTGGSAAHNITVKSLTGVTTVDLQPTYVFVDNFESLECLYHAGNYEIF